MVERYEGSREQEAIHIGQHIWHKRWGEGVITKTTEEELLDIVTVKFAECEKTVLRCIIDGYEKTLIQVKKKLSSNYNQEIIKLIYEKL